jgi:hypothetical protein
MPLVSCGQSRGCRTTSPNPLLRCARCGWSVYTAGPSPSRVHGHCALWAVAPKCTYEYPYGRTSKKIRCRKQKRHQGAGKAAVYIYIYISVRVRVVYIYTCSGRGYIDTKWQLRSALRDNTQQVPTICPWSERETGGYS